MNICGSCSVEMVCSKNGMVAVWNKDHARSGDMFRCDNCSATVLIANSESYVLHDLSRQALEAKGLLVEMD